MSKETNKMMSDCVIVPNSECPNDCRLKTISMYEKLLISCNPFAIPTFVQEISDNLSLNDELDIAKLNTVRALHYLASPRHCKNLHKLLKPHEEY